MDGLHPFESEAERDEFVALLHPDLKELLMERIVGDNVAVFDLDGCVADDAWRRDRIPEGAQHPLQYDFYHAGCGQDQTLVPGEVRLKEHIAAGHFIAFATARPFKVAALTSEWIKERFGLTPNKEFMILMRKDDDARSSVDVKREFVGYLRRYEQDSGRKIVSLYDDRQDIIDLYLSEGFTGVHRLDAAGLHTPAEQAAPNNPPLNFEQQARESGLGVPITSADMLEASARINELNGMDGYKPADEKFGHGPTFLGGLGEETSEEEETPVHVSPDMAAENLKAAFKTFVSRQQTYGPNDIVYAKVMKNLFPGKVVLSSEQDHRMFLMIMHAVGKLTRFTSSGMTHSDSAHDLINYAAFLELLASEHSIEVI